MDLHTQSAEKVLEKSLTKLGQEKNAISMHFNLSKLKLRRENKEHLSIALNILRDHLKSLNGEILLMQDGDIMVIHKGSNIKALTESVYQLRYLFADDKLAYNDNGTENSEFCSFYNSENNWNEFINLCLEKIKLLANNDLTFKPKPAVNQNSMLTFISQKIEDTLSNADCTQVIKMYPVFMILDNQPKKILEEIRIDIQSLKFMLGDRLDIVNNSNLFGYVLEFLDIRLLIKLINMIRENPNSYYFNLCMNTLKSEEFEIFDNAISEYMKKSLIIGIHISDVYRDLTEFFKVQKRLVKSGYKLCLHGLDNITFLHIDRAELGFDLIKLKWEPSFIRQNYQEFENQLRNKIQISGSSRIIFANCDSNKALEMGNKLGIGLYQGNYVNENYKK